MILRVTAKLGKKIKHIPSEALPLDADPFADWSAHLFTAERRQYILLANTTSLYTVVMPGRGITSVDTFVRGMQLSLDPCHEIRRNGSRRSGKPMLMPETRFPSAGWSTRLSERENFSTWLPRLL